MSAQEHLKSLNKDYFDQTTPAGTDFYRHVTKGWQDSHPLTDEYSRYGQFNVLND
jgi:putative endopeptidase